jgi:hypothetical protein
MSLVHVCILLDTLILSLQSTASIEVSLTSLVINRTPYLNTGCALVDCGRITLGPAATFASLHYRCSCLASLLAALSQPRAAPATAAGAGGNNVQNSGYAFPPGAPLNATAGFAAGLRSEQWHTAPMELFDALQRYVAPSCLDILGYAMLQRVYFGSCFIACIVV